MIAQAFETEDIATLAEILEGELIAHRRKCQLCFVMFMLAFVTLLGALAVVGVQLAFAVSTPSGIEGLGGKFAFFQVLATLAGVVMLFFGNWWAAQNCLHSIERTLCAARNRRVKLFQTFLGEIKCADKAKREAWLEIVKSVVM